MLDAAGLGPAITALADASDVAVDVDCDIGERLPPWWRPPPTWSSPRSSKPRQQPHVRPADSPSRSLAATAHLVLDIDESIEIIVDADDLEHLHDRVGAAGGRLDVTENRITARLPCES